jgi:hypothetical protein
MSRNIADQYVDYSRRVRALRFTHIEQGTQTLYGLAEDGTVWEAAWSEGHQQPQIEGWRPVNMQRYDEEYLT